MFPFERTQFYIKAAASSPINVAFDLFKCQHCFLLYYNFNANTYNYNWIVLVCSFVGSCENAIIMKKGPKRNPGIVAKRSPLLDLVPSFCLS